MCTSRETAFRVLAVQADLTLAQSCGFVFYTILYLYLYPNSHPASLPQSLIFLGLKKIVLSRCSKLECGKGVSECMIFKVTYSWQKLGHPVAALAYVASMASTIIIQEQI